MAQSFTVRGGSKPAQSSVRRKVLVTGAAGNIGSYFAEHGRKKYDLRLMVRPTDDEQAIKKLSKWGEVVKAELSELERLKEHCVGIDTIVHMAANPSPNTDWESALNDNIIGTYNIFVAAKSAGCRRVIYASSIHAVSGYPDDVQVKTSEPVNPGDLYGVTKCFGEALGRYMAEKEGVSCIALRIGAFQPLEAAEQEKGIWMMDAFVSRRDLNQLIEKSIDVENLTFAILHGLSNNRFKRLDISDARELVGYDPQDDLTDINPDIKKLHLRKRVHSHNVKDEQQKSGIRNEVAPPRRRTRR
ncbi:MAG TPA: NAD(P)-dependent oxidoreductase [Tepidisphaeraceae bacterium]|jgi:nucleoside-diphosphate-sugar epimerase